MTELSYGSEEDEVDYWVHFFRLSGDHSKHARTRAVDFVKARLGREVEKIENERRATT